MDQPQLVRQLLENRDALLGFILALTRDYAAAEEIFQETSLAILEEAREKPAIDNFMAWARAIARRRVAEYYRKASRRAGIEQLSAGMAEMIAQAFAENTATPEHLQIRMQFLLECLNRLTGRSQEVIAKFYQGRQSLKDIAAAMNWQPDSVKVALARARKALADCIQVKLAQQGH
jgi:RNA polymerase sigma-70 factor, ECF subfamily